MPTHATAEFKVTNWDEDETLDADGGSKVTHASVNGSTSTSITVGVQPGMTLTKITKGRISTHVTGASSFAGKFVKLQHLTGSSWITVKQLRLNGNSTAIFSATVLPKGHSTIRVVMSVNQAGPGYLGGKSRTLSYTRS